MLFLNHIHFSLYVVFSFLYIYIVCRSSRLRLIEITEHDAPFSFARLLPNFQTVNWFNSGCIKKHEREIHPIPQMEKHSFLPESATVINLRRKRSRIYIFSVSLFMYAEKKIWLRTNFISRAHAYLPPFIVRKVYFDRLCWSASCSRSLFKYSSR